MDSRRQPLSDLGHFLLQGTYSLPHYSDKAIFPASILSLVVDHYQSDLPHPLIFRLQTNKKSCYVGVKEFSSPEETIIVPQHIIEKLEASDNDPVSVLLESSVPKATYLTLKPLQFYPEITNWKYYLESKLPSLYTTLRTTETLVIEGDHKYELLIEDSNNSTVCIIDTDIILDVIPLNDIMANQQLAFDNNLNYLNNIQEIEGEVEVYDLAPIGTSMAPRLFKVDITKLTLDFLTIELLMDASEFIKNDYSTLFNVDLVVGLDKLINLENFQYTTIDDDFIIQKALTSGSNNNRFKSVLVSLKDDQIVNKLHKGAEETDEEGKNPERFIYLIPFAWESASNISIRVIDGVRPTGTVSAKEENENDIQCKNCLKSIPNEKLPLHEAFCYRNNKLCSCGQVFLREIPSNHWHCGPCNNDVLINGNLTLLKFKHDKLHHLDTYVCEKCPNVKYDNFLDLVLQHKGSTCPHKLHECKFCHLILPQEELLVEDKFANLTHHENTCGNKTTECYKCNKVLRTKDLNKHLKLHDLDKQKFNEIHQLTFSKCSNVNCIYPIDNNHPNEMGLCEICYGPLYIPQHDPSNIKLQSRIERKYMIQLSKGCGNSWCQNLECLTGNGSASKRTIKELLDYIKQDLFPQISRPQFPVNKDRDPGVANKVYFCVNQSVSDKKKLVEKIDFEQQYNTAIIYKAVQVGGTSEHDVRVWLHENGLAPA